MGGSSSTNNGGGCFSCCSAPEVSPNPEWIDLSHFELLKVVGKGGFGKVNAITRKFDQQLMALKRMAKAEVIKKESHIRMVWTERNIMSKLSDMSYNPFLVQLEHAFQSERELFFVMEFMQGDLRFHLSKRGLLSESECRFYAAEMVLALESMHRQKIIYRDFKPDNVLLDSEGHVRLSDFGLAVQLEEKYHYVMKGNAGTGGYLAPEIWAGEYYGISPDCWSLGITIYELLHGRRPYRRWNPDKHYIDKIKFHPHLSAAARAFIKGLLTVDPRKRLACGPSGWNEVKAHPFFAKIDWSAIQNKILKPPIRPDLKQANCSNQADLADQLLDKKPAEISQNYQKYFTGFDYNINFGEWLIKNEKRKEERARRQEEVRRLKEEHKQLKRMQYQHMMMNAANSNPSSMIHTAPIAMSPSNSSIADSARYQQHLSMQSAAAMQQRSHVLFHPPISHHGTHASISGMGVALDPGTVVGGAPSTRLYAGTALSGGVGVAGGGSVAPHSHQLSFDIPSPAPMGAATHSWQMSVSDDGDSAKHSLSDSDLGVVAANPHTSLGMLMAANHSQISHSHSHTVHNKQQLQIQPPLSMPYGLMASPSPQSSPEEKASQNTSYINDSHQFNHSHASPHTNNPLMEWLQMSVRNPSSRNVGMPTHHSSNLAGNNSTNSALFGLGIGYSVDGKLMQISPPTGTNLSPGTTNHSQSNSQPATHLASHTVSSQLDQATSQLNTTTAASPDNESVAGIHSDLRTDCLPHDNSNDAVQVDTCDVLVGVDHDVDVDGDCDVHGDTLSPVSTDNVSGPSPQSLSGAAHASIEPSTTPANDPNAVIVPVMMSSKCRCDTACNNCEVTRQKLSHSFDSVSVPAATQSVLPSSSTASVVRHRIHVSHGSRRNSTSSSTSSSEAHTTGSVA